MENLSSSQSSGGSVPTPGEYMRRYTDVEATDSITYLLCYITNAVNGKLSGFRTYLCGNDGIRNGEFLVRKLALCMDTLHNGAPDILLVALVNLGILMDSFM